MKIAVLALISIAQLTAQPPSPRAAAPIDITGYWVSVIVDEWRFRVTPQKGDIPYLPLNPEARRIANNWDPDKDSAEGNACRAYGAVGVMQRPGRIHITWDGDTALKAEFDAGTQARTLRFGMPFPHPPGEPTWQGISLAQWELPGAGAGRGRALQTRATTGQLRVVTTNMRPGYIRKNGVPYSGMARLTEQFNLIAGAQGEQYLLVTATVDDPVYLTAPFIRSYTFKKEADGRGWDPTPCWPK